MSTTTHSPNAEVSLTYKFLLSFSTISAVFFCWLYITKPTHVTSAPVSERSNDSVSIAPEEASAPVKSSFDTLSSGVLPGESVEMNTHSDASAASQSIPLASTPSTKGKIGWEETNDSVQHVLTAQNGTTSERIILEVPVIYQTRGLRLGPKQAQEAARVLRALTIYQAQITKLHQDGKNIQQAWNSLLLGAQPIASLRADSPSLPKAAHPDTLSENSSATINISK